ncbi:conserved hypothetical protein [Talaromyces stipitatus ATCC 10500]|uniref:DUF1990 domain-containing protein n=1 Tax=Talaromyces stipitatus (strain ATCC 10500 / CBS 375.48 / QM 6759 / NRRL 1006) TaxID=441959 RepID=B8MRE8_TALSN|nr:uncharacterized protein TSTA_055450 [Talaromyces stipitatus ATCC 10500]EED13043.1 conserved hypothetical protein [Talaromyces stipitatus ATCC 10500]
MAIETQIEIAAAPSRVREIVRNPFPFFSCRRLKHFKQLLDFSKYPQWHTSLIKLLEPEDNSKSFSSLQPGDKIKCNIDGMEFVADIMANTEKLFQWQGPLVYSLISGLHSFHFESANNDGSSTIFRQTEKFTGPIAFLMVPSLLGRKLLGQYNRFNRELKVYAEGSG